MASQFATSDGRETIMRIRQHSASKRRHCPQLPDETDTVGFHPLHLARVTLMVIEDEATYRLHVSLLCTNAIMAQSDDFADLFEQQRFRHEDSPSVRVMRMKRAPSSYLSWRQKIVPCGVRPIQVVKVGQKAQITAFSGPTQLRK